MQVTRKSIFSGKERTREIPVTEEQYAKWQSGMLIQVAMPNLTPEDREFIITGLDEEEWNEMFGEDNEE